LGLKTNITEMFGIKYPILAAPMGPFYTTDLTIAVSEAGGLGVLSHTNLFGKSSLTEMKKNMEYVVEHTDKPRDKPKLREQCLYIVTSAGTPKMIQNNAFKKLKDGGSNIKHFHVAPALWLADKCVAAGCDGMVITGWEGGGHQSYEKISSLVLLQQVKEKHPDIPLIACGGIATGEGMAAALSLGAGGIAMGSRFIASKESEFHENYKNIVPSAGANDTMWVTGVLGPIRLWRNKYSLDHGVVTSKEEKMALEAQLTPQKALEDQKHYEMTYNGNIDDGAVLLGQSIGLIKSIESVKDIMDNMVKTAEKSLINASKMVI